MPPTILVVDDNPVTLKMVRVVLEAEGYEVLAADCGAAALDLLATTTPDLIVQDIVLPDVDGFALARRMRALPGGDAIPIIAFSGLGQRDRERGAVAGFTDYLFKPVEPSRLVRTVQRHLAVRPGVAGTGQRVLVVDDDPVLLKLAALRLRKHGFAVMTARDGAEALALARRSRPDVILSDVLMPELDGFRFCLEVRRDPTLWAVPVVLTSALFIDEADRRLAMRVGANALVPRTPEDGDAIVDMLVSVLEKPASVAEVIGDLPTGEYMGRILSQLQRQWALNGASAERLAIREAELAVLKGLTEAAGAARSVEDMLEELLRRALDVAGATMGAVYLAGAGGRLELAAHSGYPENALAALHDAFGCRELLGLVLDSGEAVTVPSLKVPDHEAVALLGGARATAMALAPIVACGERFGVLVIASPTSDREWAAFAEALAGQIGQSIALTRSFSRLRTTEGRLADVISASPAVIFVLRPTDGGFDRTWTSDNVVALTGYTAHEALTIQEWWLRNVHPEDRPAALGNGEEVLRHGHAVAEYRFRHKDGGYRWIRDELRIKGDTGMEPQVIGSWVDVTERRRRDESLRQTEKLATMSQLLAGVAHELNNPLAVVIGQAELMARTLGTGPGAERALRLGKAAARCGRIVKNFLALVRQQPPEQSSVALNTVVQDALELLAYPLRVDDIETHLDLAPDVPRLWADAHQLHQVVVNLITNAHQAMRQSPQPRRLTVTTRHDPAAGRVRLTVSDSGPGVAPAIQDRIFEPFFTTKPPGQGTGLGLALCRGMVEGHGGTLSVESPAGQGARFTVELPLPPPAEDEPTPPATDAARAGTNARVLVVDDEPDVACALADMLALAGHTVDTATSGRRAIEMMTAAAYDLVFTDVRMPEMDGYALCEEAARRSPTAGARFVFVTGDTLSAVNATRPAAAVTLIKPFTVDDVVAAVRARLEVVERLGGRVRCESAEGLGSTFSFTLPRARSRSWVSR